MISSISPGRYLQVSGPKNPVIQDKYHGGMGIGNMRYNLNIHQVEVFDGSIWLPVTDRCYIDLAPDALQILEWANKKMLEEARLEKLAETHPTIADLTNQIKEKRNQIDMIYNLIKEENKA